MTRPRVILNEVIVQNLQIQEEGTNVGNNRPRTLNFTGDVDLDRDGDTIEINVDSGSSSSGDVVGPASAVDNEIVLFDGSTGKLIKSSGVTLSSKVSSVSTGNGVTVDNTDPINPIVNLGGTLTQNADISGAFDLSFGGTGTDLNSYTVNTSQLITFQSSANGIVFTAPTSSVNINGAEAEIEGTTSAFIGYGGVGGPHSLIINSTGAVITLTGANTFKEAADYSANYGARSYVSKSYTDAQVATKVSSVSGTTNRVTSTGGTTPVIDISASYVGQSSITTTGTLTSGATGAGFTVALGSSTITGDLAFSNLTQGSARSVLGITGNATADFASIQGTTDQVLRVDGTGTGLSFGSIDLSKSATVGSSILPVANGGTSFSSYTTGDLIQASGSGTLDKLNSVATGNALISGGVGTVSSWGKITSSHVDSSIQASGLAWLLTGTSTLTGSTTITGAQTLTFSNTTTDFTGTDVRMDNGTFKIWNPARTFTYSFSGSAIAANRAVTLPVFVAASNMLGIASSQAVDNRVPFLSGTSGLTQSSANFTFVTNRLIGTTMYLTLSAGTATAGTAPLVMTSGTNLSAAISGAVEYNNTFHMTNSDTTRRHVVLAASSTKTTAGAPYTNDGYITVNIGGTDVKIMTTA